MKTKGHNIAGNKEELRFSRDHKARARSPLRKIFPDKLEHWKRDDELVRQGDIMKRVYLIRSGWICRGRSFLDADECYIASYVMGDFINLDAVTETASSDTLRTLGDCTTSSISVSKLRKYFREDPKIAKSIFQWQAAELDQHRIAVGVLSSMDALRRITVYLYGQFIRLKILGHPDAQNGRLVLPFNQTDVGKIMGVTNVHVSRSFKALKEDGILEKVKGSWTIVNAEKLDLAVRGFGVDAFAVRTL